MGQLAIPLMLAGTAVSAYSQYQQGQAMESQGDSALNEALAEQQLHEYNAKLKEREAAARLASSREEARQFAREGEALKGSQQVNLAKGGVLTAGGSPALLMEDTARELELEKNQILREGFLAESFAKSEAEGLRYQGRAAAVRGENIKRGYEAAGRGKTLQAAGTLLTGFGSAYSLTRRPGITNDMRLARKHGIA